MKTKKIMDTVKIKDLVFKNPNLLVYSSVLSKINSNDIASAYEILFDSCINVLENIYEYDEKISYFSDLSEAFLKLKESTITKSENVYTIKVGDKEVLIKHPSRDEFKEIFNLNISSSVMAWQYIYTTLYVSGYKFNLDNFDDLQLFVSCNQIPTIILYNKQLDLKKK